MDRSRLRIPAFILMLFALHLGCLASYGNAAVEQDKASSSTNKTDIGSMPQALQAAFSASVGHDDSAYAINSTDVGYHGSNAGNNLSMDFLSDGFNIHSGTSQWGLKLKKIGYGNELHAVTVTAPKVAANRVEYLYGGMSEWYVNGPLGLEQGFTIDHAPAEERNGGPLTLELSSSGDLSPKIDSAGTGLLLTELGGKQILRYSGLSAVDATGRQLHTWLELDGSRLSVRVDDSGATYPIIVDPWVQQAKVIASDGAANDQFGFVVHMSANGSTALIGAPIKTVGNNSYQGVAYVFTRSGSTWTQQAELIASDGATNDLFGIEGVLSADGSTVLIGVADKTVGNNSHQGVAYVFTRSGSTWTQQAELIASDGAAYDEFGYEQGHLSADGNTALIGAPNKSVGNNSRQGVAYVFTRSGSTWMQQAELIASDGAAYDFFGNGILSADGSTALIGAGTNQASGAVYVFTRCGYTWTQQQKLTLSDFGIYDSFFPLTSLGVDNMSADGNTALIEAAKDYGHAMYAITRTGSTWSYSGSLASGSAFGYSSALSADGSTALIGDGGAAGFSTECGGDREICMSHVYVYTHTASTWAQQQELIPSDGNGNFGMSLSLSADGSIAFVGDDKARTDISVGAGAAYMFTRSGSTWTQQQELTASDGMIGDLFGDSVALSADGGTAFIGAEGINSGQGAAYVFTFSRTYVSDLPWAGTPVNGWGPVEKDMSNGEQAAGDGHTISLHGAKYAKGLGVHAKSIVTYNLGGQYSGFVSDIGIDDETGGYGSVIFQVWGDGTKLYDSGIVNAASAIQRVNVSVAGVSTLQLMVLCGNGTDGDHADWAGAYLVTRSSESTPPVDTTPPTVPASLIATAVSSSEIDLTWSAATDNVGVAGYKIYRNGNSVPIASVTTGTSYADKGLTASTTYTYQVSAYDAAGNESAQSTPPVSATTLSTGSGGVYISDLTWASATNGWGPVEKDMSNGEQAAGDGHEITIGGVKYAKGIGCHAQSIITYNLAGKYSSFLSDIGIDDEVLSAGGGSVEFQVWGDGKKLYDSGTSPYITSGQPAQHVNVSVAGVNTLTLEVLVGSSSSNDHADWAGAYLVTGSTPPPDTTPPTVPGSLTATAVSSSEIDLTWSASTDNVGVAGYKIYRNGNSVPIASVTTGTSYADEGLTASTTYTYNVSAYDAAGNESAQSTPPVSATTLSAGSGTTTYISDLTWTSATNGWGPVEKDMSNGEQAAGDGHTITLLGVKYAKGLGCHAKSVITYNLAGAYSRFISDIGIDDEVSGNTTEDYGSVVFQVFGDGVKLYDSGTMTHISATQHINVSVTGVHTLQLQVNVGSTSSGDHADWAGAYLSN